MSGRHALDVGFFVALAAVLLLRFGPELRANLDRLLAEDGER